MDNLNEPTTQGQPTNKINWRQFGKHWIVVFILAILAGAVIWSLLNLGSWLKAWQDQRAAQSLKDQLEKQYAQDKYGGKTPEETYGMFISALEQNDVSLASKYFVLEKQGQWSKTLEEYKNAGLISEFLQELKDTEKEWKTIQTKDPNAAEFDYSFVVEKDTVDDLNGQKLTVKAGNYTGSVLFQKYSSGVWKLGAL